jgi:hypothetical protein
MRRRKFENKNDGLLKPGIQWLPSTYPEIRIFPKVRKKQFLPSASFVNAKETIANREPWRVIVYIMPTILAVTDHM